MALLLAFIVTLVPVSLGHAFHEDIPTCKSGEYGYLAHLMADGHSYAFLSRTDPPSADSIICNIPPRQMVKTLALEKES